MCNVVEWNGIECRHTLSVSSGLSLDHITVAISVNLPNYRFVNPPAMLGVFL